MLKVRLSPHGYTMVGKAVEAHNLVYLRHERNVYDRLSPLQGRSVPVSVGQVGLDVPYYDDGAELRLVLLMSWASKSLADSLLGTNDSANLLNAALQNAPRQLAAVHERNILHNDPELRNWLYDKAYVTLMLADFERAAFVEPRSHGRRSPNPPFLGLAPSNKRRRFHESSQTSEDAGQPFVDLSLNRLSHEMLHLATFQIYIITS